MLIDMHVHTTRYSTCSHMEPEELAEQAIRCGLDGIVITEHGTIWSIDEVSALRDQFPNLTILRATEISAADRHDVLVYGVTDLRDFSQGMPVSHVVELAHRHGGIAILAHPIRFHKSLSAEVCQTPFDAWETRSINIDPLDHPRCIELAVKHGVPQVYNTDAHDTISLGAYANRFHVPIHDELDLIQAIKAQSFTPLVRERWAAPAISTWEKAREKRIQRYVRQGLTDVDDIWQRMGGAPERIEQVLAQSHKR